MRFPDFPHNLHEPLPTHHLFKTLQSILPDVVCIHMESSFQPQHPKSGPAKGGTPQCCRFIATTPPFDSPHCCTVNPNPGRYNSWSAGFFDCCEDRYTCCMTAIVPCFTFARIARFADDASALRCVMKGSVYCVLSMVGMNCCYSYVYRERLRMKLHLPGNRTSDFVAHCLCECCALCQEYHQIKYSAMPGEAVKSGALSPPSINTIIR